MTTRRALLLGMIIGQLAAYPTIYRLAHRPPRVVADLVSDSVLKTYQPRYYVIKNVTGKFHSHSPLVIYLTSQEDVRKRFLDSFGEDSPSILGFYNERDNSVTCVDESGVLIHELRHVFEGYFHS